MSTDDGAELAWRVTLNPEGGPRSRSLWRYEISATLTRDGEPLTRSTGTDRGWMVWYERRRLCRAVLAIDAGRAPLDPKARRVVDEGSRRVD